MTTAKSSTGLTSTVDLAKVGSDKTITVTKVGCARCGHRFSVLNIDSLVEFACPQCKGVHIRVKGVWYDAHILDLYKDWKQDTL
jgi:hypothetical protein